MKKNLISIKKLAIVTVFAATLFASRAFAMMPTASIANEGSATILVSGYGDPNSSVQLDYLSQYGTLQNLGLIATTNAYGYFTATINPSSYLVTGGQQVYVMINGQQSQPIQWPYLSGTGSLYGTAYVSQYGTTYGTSYGNQYGYGSTYGYSQNQLNQQVTLSQNNLQLAQGQSQTLSIYGGTSYSNSYQYPYQNNQYYLLTNSTPNSVSAMVSGNALYLQALSGGAANVTVCQTSTYGGSSQNCATVYVTVPSYQSYGGYYGGNCYGYSYGNQPYCTYPYYR